MHQLLRTSKDANHYHIVYLDAETGMAFCAAAGKDKHVHELKPIQGEDGSVSWEVEVLADGHTHTLQEYEPKIKKPEADDEEIISEVVSLFKIEQELEADSVERGKESEEFYCGDQWDEGLRTRLENTLRACLTINLTQRHIDELCGHQRQLRTDLRFLPTGEGDQRVADILNILSKHALEQCFYEREESKVFEDQVIPGRGNFNLYVNFDEDIQGTPKVEQFPWRNIAYGPHEKEDLSDCEHLTKHRMYSLGKLKSLYPEKKDELDVDYRDYVEAVGKSRDSGGDEYANAAGKTPQSIGGYVMVDIAKKEYRVLEQWRKIYLDTAVAFDQQTEETFSLFGWKDADIKAVKTIPGVYVIEKTIQKIRITRVCGTVLLSDEYPADLPIDDFFVIPVYGHKKGTKFWGKVEILKDSQREVNKRASQSIDIANRMCTYGHFFDQSTFPSPEEMERFKRNSAIPGFLQEVTSVSNPPRQAEGVKFPNEVVSLQQMAIENLAHLANITIAPDEGGSPGEILQRQRMKLVGNEFLFDNLSFAKKKLGRLLVAIFQRYYSPERIYRIISAANNKAASLAGGQGVMVGGQPFEEISKQEIIDLLQNEDLAKYDVIVSESTWSPSERIAIMLMLKEMEAGPEVIIPLSDIPEEQKAKILQSIQGQQQAQQDAEAQKSETEIQKTLIAQGYLPPKVAQEQGLAPPEQPVPNGVDPSMAVQNEQTSGLAGYA